MPSQLLKSCYAERNPSTLYTKGVQFYFTFGLQEEGLSLMKRAADAGYERAVYTHAITQAIFLCDGKYFHGIPREWVQRIGKLDAICEMGMGFVAFGRSSPKYFVHFKVCSVVLRMPMCNTCVWRQY
uniref:At2g35280-like TPR domain-containing protein n=1 Tax=Brassica oleracea TaxID=3712 RepID=A0A3P6FBZ2_BRAOL|nr:unnamed protein product [Brassica oleracea]